MEKSSSPGRTARDPAPPWAPCPQLQSVQGRRKSEDGSNDPPARWVIFVSASPRCFAPPITTVPAEGPSAEWFDRSLPRHPPGADLALSCCDSPFLISDRS